MIKKKFWLSLLTISGIATIPVAVMSANTSNAVVKNDNSTNKTTSISKEDYKKLLNEIENLKNSKKGFDFKEFKEWSDKRDKRLWKVFIIFISIASGGIILALIFVFLERWINLKARGLL